MINEAIRSTEEIKKRTIEKYENDTGYKNASIYNNQLTNVNNDNIVIIRDENNKILGHYQEIKFGCFTILPPDLYKIY